MIDELTQALSLTPEQKQKLADWVKANVKSKTCQISLTAEDVEDFGFADEGHLIDTYRQKAALEARLLHTFTKTEEVRDDGKKNVTLTFSLQAVK